MPEKMPSRSVVEADTALGVAVHPGATEFSETVQALMALRSTVSKSNGVTDPHDMPRLPLPVPVVDALREWHDQVGWACAAHGEGLDCCLDVLLGTAGDLK